MKCKGTSILNKRFIERDIGEGIKRLREREKKRQLVERVRESTHVLHVMTRRSVPWDKEIRGESYMKGTKRD